MADSDRLLWEVRAFIFGHFVETTRPPTAGAIAREFQLPDAKAYGLMVELHNRHAIYLDLEARRIRMANPFSGVPTAFHTVANGRRYPANCAWDCFGIAAALHSNAQIDAHCADSGEPLALGVGDGQAIGGPALAHFLVPFRSWYDDLPHT